MLRKIAPAVAALACLVGPSLLISRPLLAHMQERSDTRRSLETTFYEAGKPVEGEIVVSAVPRPG